MQKSGEIRPITQSFSLPPELGILEPGSSANPAVFIIQDAHGHYEAQKNTQKILEFLDKRGLSSVLVEGGAGPLKKEKIHFFRQEAFNRKAADVLAREAQIGGAELFLLTARPGLKAEGLESEELYLQNLKSYQDVWALKAQTGEWLERDLTEIRDEASKVFPKELLEFFKSWVLFEEGVSDFPVFLASLQKNAHKTLGLDLEDPRSQMEWPMLVRYAELKKREPRLDETSARAELKKLTAWARKAGLERGMVDFLEAEDSGKEAVGLRSFWENFYEQAGPKGFRFSDYSALSLLEGFKILGAEIQFPDLMAEAEKLQRLVLERSVREPAQKNLIEKFHGHLLVKKLLSLSMTREEVKALEARESARPRDPAIREAFEKALRFYRIAAARDASMARKALSLGASPASPAAVIAGGFHTQSLKKMLEDRGLTCAVVTPHMTSLGGQDAYTRAMTGEEAVVDFGASSVRVASWVSDWKRPLPGSVPAQRKKLLDVIKKWGVGQGADWESLKPAPRSEIRNLPNAGDKIEMGGESYSIASILGEGGTGRVYLAQPVREGGRPAAVKYVRYETRGENLGRRKALHEFSTQERAGKNPGGAAAEAYGWDSVEDYVRIMMEYLPGELLYSWHFGKSNSSRLEALKKFIAAVAETHKRGIVHLDLKTAGAQVLPDESIKILDFGFSQLDGVPAPLADPEDFTGTLDYMAPEIVSEVGPYTPATDVFSLGVSLFEVMTGGQPLFPNSSISDVAERSVRLASILPGLDTRLPGFWKPFAPLLRRALDPVPARRFQDGQAVLDEFLRIASGLPGVTGRPVVQPPDSSRSEVRTLGVSQLPLLDYREASQGWRKIFGNDHPVRVELGIGDGRQLYDLALANPDQNFVGVELPSRTENEKRAADYKKFSGMPNVRLIFTEAEKALSAFQPGSIRQFLVLYPPPRREAMEGEKETARGKIPELLSARMPLVMARILENGGQIRVLTERDEYSRILEKRFLAESGFKVQRVKLFPGEDPASKMGFDLSYSQFNELFRERMKTVTYILTADKRSEMRVTPSDFTQLITDTAQSVVDSLSPEESRLTNLDGFLRLTALAARQKPSFAGLTAGKQVYVLDALKKSFLRQWGVDHGFRESFDEMLLPGDIRLGLQAAAARNPELLWRFSTKRTRIQVASAETSLALPTDYASKPLDIYRSEAPFHFLMLQDRSHPDNYLLFQVSGGNLFIRHASETEFRQLAKQATVRLADDPSFRIFDGQIAASERVLTASPKTDSPFSGKMFASFTVNAKLTEPSQIRVRRPSGKIYRDYQSAEMVYEDIRVPGQPQQVLRFLSYPGIDSSFTIDGVTVEGLRNGQPFSQPLLIVRIPGDSDRKTVYINRILDMIRTGELAQRYSAQGLQDVRFNINAALINILRFEAPHYETSTGAARTLKNYRVWVDETNAVVPYRLIPDGDIVGEPLALRSEMRVFQEEFRARLEKLSEFVMDPAKTQGDAEWWADLEWWVSFYDSASSGFENLHQPENTRLLASVIGASKAIFGYYNQLLETKARKGTYGDRDRGKSVSLEKPIPTSLLDKLVKARKLAPTDRFSESFLLEKVRRKAFPVQEAREILLDLTARAYRVLAGLENDERKGGVPREYPEDFDALNIRNSREILASHLMVRERESGFHFWPEFIYWGAPANVAQEQGVAVYPHNFLTIREGGAEPDSTPERFSAVMTSVSAPVKTISTILTGKVNMLPSMEAETAAAEPQFRFRRFLVLKKPLPRFPEKNELTAAFLEEYFISDPYEIAALFELSEDSTPERRREVLERVREFAGQGRLLFQDYYSVFEKGRIPQYANFVANSSGRPEESRALEVAMRRYFEMQDRELPEMMKRTGLQSEGTAEDNYRIWQVMDAALSIVGGEKKHHQRMATVIHASMISQALLPGAEAQIPRPLFVLWGAGKAKDNSWLIPHARPAKVPSAGFRKIMGGTPVKRAGEGADVRHEDWDRANEKFNKMETNLKRRKFREAFEAASGALPPELRKPFEAQVSYAVMKVMGLPGADAKPRDFAAGIYDGFERQQRSADNAFSPLALSLRPDILSNIRKNYDSEWTAILESFKDAGREDASAALSAHLLEMARYRYALTAAGLPSFDLAGMPVFDFNSVKSQADWQRYLFDPILAQIREGGISEAIARREEFARAEAEKYGLILEIHQALREKNFRALFGKMKELIARAKREGLAFMPAGALQGFERDLEDLKVVFTDQLITSLGRFEGRSQEAVPMMTEGIDILGEVPESLREVAAELGLVLPETQAPAPVVQAVEQPPVTGVQPVTTVVVTTEAAPEVTVAAPRQETEVSLPFVERLERITSWIERPAEAEARPAEEWRRDAEWFFSLYSDEAARAGLSEDESKALQHAEKFMTHFYKQAWNSEKRTLAARDMKASTLLGKVRNGQLSGEALRTDLLDYAAQAYRILAALREDRRQPVQVEYPSLNETPDVQRAKLRNFLIALEEQEAEAPAGAPERSKPAFFFFPRFEGLGLDPDTVQEPDSVFGLYKILIMREAGLEMRYTPSGLAITFMDVEKPVIALSVSDESQGPLQPPYLVAAKDVNDPRQRFFRIFVLKKPLPAVPQGDELTPEFISEYFVTDREELMQYGISANASLQRRNDRVDKLVLAAREGRLLPQSSFLLYSREGAQKWADYLGRTAEEKRALRLAMYRRLRMHQAEMPKYFTKPQEAADSQSLVDVASAWKVATSGVALETGASREAQTRRALAVWAEESLRDALTDEKTFFAPLAALLGATETVTIPAKGDQGPQLQRRLLFEAREGSIYVQKFRDFYREAVKNKFFEKFQAARESVPADLRPLFDFQVLDGILQLVSTGQTLKNRVALVGLAQRLWKQDTVNLAPAALYVRVMKDSETRIFYDLGNRWLRLMETLTEPRGENHQAAALELATEISALNFYLSNGFEKVQDTELTKFSANPAQWDRLFAIIREKVSAPKYRAALESRARMLEEIDSEHRQIVAIRKAYEEGDDETFFAQLAAFRAMVARAGEGAAVPQELLPMLDGWRDFLAADFAVRLSSEVEEKLAADDFQGARALVDRAERILGAGVETESLSQIREGILDSEREARGATWGMVWTKLAEPLDVSPESDMAAAAGRMGTDEAARAREVMAARKTAEKPDATSLELTRVLDQASVWKGAEGGYAESIAAFEELVRTKLAAAALSEAAALESAENFAGVLALVDAVAPRLADPQPLVQIRDALRQRGQDAWKNFEEGLDRPLDQPQAESMARNLTLARKIRAAFGVTDETSPEAADMALEYRRIAESAGENEAGVRDLADVLAGLNEILERRSEMRVDTARLETLRGLASARLETSVRAVVLAKTSDPRVAKRDYVSAFRLLDEVKTRAGQMAWLETLRSETEKQGSEAENRLWTALVSPLNQPQSAVLAKNFELFEAVRKGVSGAAPEDFYYTLIGFREEAEDNAVTFERLVEMRDQVRALGSAVTRTERESFEKLLDARAELKASKTIKSLREDRKYKKAREAMAAALAKLGGARPAIEAERLEMTADWNDLRKTFWETVGLSLDQRLVANAETALLRARKLEEEFPQAFRHGDAYGSVLEIRKAVEAGPGSSVQSWIRLLNNLEAVRGQMAPEADSFNKFFKLLEAKVVALVTSEVQPALDRDDAQEAERIFQMYTRMFSREPEAFGVLREKITAKKQLNARTVMTEKLAELHARVESTESRTPEQWMEIVSALKGLEARLFDDMTEGWRADLARAEEKAGTGAKKEVNKLLIQNLYEEAAARMTVLTGVLGAGADFFEKQKQALRIARKDAVGEFWGDFNRNIEAGNSAVDDMRAALSRHRTLSVILGETPELEDASKWLDYRQKAEAAAALPTPVMGVEDENNPYKAILGLLEEAAPDLQSESEKVSRAVRGYRIALARLFLRRANAEFFEGEDMDLFMEFLGMAADFASQFGIDENDLSDEGMGTFFLNPLPAAEKLEYYFLMAEMFNRTESAENGQHFLTTQRGAFRDFPAQRLALDRRIIELESQIEWTDDVPVQGVGKVLRTGAEKREKKISDLAEKYRQADSRDNAVDRDFYGEWLEVLEPEHEAVAQWRARRSEMRTRPHHSASRSPHEIFTPEQAAEIEALDDKSFIIPLGEISNEASLMFRIPGKRGVYLLKKPNLSTSGAQDSLANEAAIMREIQADVKEHSADPRHVFSPHRNLRIGVWNYNLNGLVLPYLDGENADDFFIESGRKLEPLQFLKVALAMTDVVGYLHTLQIVHRDIKPKNFFITRDGHIVLIDLNFAYSKRIQRNVIWGGTRGFTSKQQWEGQEPEYNHDVYAMGRTLLEIWLGRLNDEEKPTGISTGKLVQDIDMRGHFDFKNCPIEDIIRKAMDPEPGNRYENVQAMYEAILHRISVIKKRSEMRPSAPEDASRKENWSIGWAEVEPDAQGSFGKRYPEIAFQFVMQVLRRLETKKQVRLADIGASPTLFMPRSAAKLLPQADIDAVDLASSDLVKPKAGERITYHETNNEDTGLAAGVYDAVISTFAQDYQDMDKSTAELERLLSRDGFAVLLLHHPKSEYVEQIVEDYRSQLFDLQPLVRLREHIEKRRIDEIQDYVARREAMSGESAAPGPESFLGSLKAMYDGTPGKAAARTNALRILDQRIADIRRSLTVKHRLAENISRFMDGPESVKAFYEARGFNADVQVIAHEGGTIAAGQDGYFIWPVAYGVVLTRRGSGANAVSAADAYRSGQVLAMARMLERGDANELRKAVQLSREDSLMRAWIVERDIDWAQGGGFTRSGKLTARGREFVNKIAREAIALAESENPKITVTQKRGIEKSVKDLVLGIWAKGRYIDGAVAARLDSSSRTLRLVALDNGNGEGKPANVAEAAVSFVRRSEVRGEEAQDPRLLEQFGDKYDKKTVLEVEGSNIGTYPDEELVGKLAGGAHVFRVYIAGVAQPRNIIKVGYDLRSSRYILKEAVRLTQFAQKGIKGIPVLKRIGKMTDGNLWIELEGIAWAVSLSDYAFSGPAEVFDAILKIVDPLARVHKAGYAHNDIKAANILRNSAGETQLNDFAFAEILTRENINSGTLGYIPLTADSSQIEGKRGPDADVYALILTLASLLEDYEDEEIAALRDSYLKLIFRKYKFSSMASLIKKVNAMRSGGEAPFVQRPRSKWPSLQELTLKMTQDLTKLRSEMRVFSPSEVSVIRQRGSLLEQAFPALSGEARQALLFPSLFTVFLGIKPLYLRYSDEKGPDATVLSNEFRQVPAVWEQMALYFHPHRMYAPAFAVTALSRNDGLLRRTGVLTEEDNPELQGIVRAYSVNFPLFLNLGVRLMERLLQKFPDNSEQGAALRGALLGIPGEYVDFYLQMLRLSGQGDLAGITRESARVRTEFPDIKLVVPIGEAGNQHPYLARMIDTVYYGYSIVRNMPGFREAAEAIGLPDAVFHQEPVFLRRSEIRPSKSEDQDILRETITGSRSIDMVFDSQTFGLIDPGVQARLRRMAAEYPKNWQAGDYDRRVGIVEDKRAVAVSLPSPVTVDGETYDQAEISGVLFTEENLGQPFTGYSAGGEARKATAQESAEAIDVEFGSDGRVRLTPKRFPQYGGHGSETADKKFYNARTLLPSMKVRSSLAAGYGKYRDEKLRHLGVFITLSKSAAGMRFEGTLQSVEDDFSQALRQEVSRVKTGVRIWTAEDPTGEKEIFNRVMDMPYGGEGYGGRTYRQIFTRAMEKYGEELWSLIAKGLYPNSPHFGNFEMDILGDAPALWHDLGGWKRRQQDRLSDPQAFAYAYWALHYAITIIHRDRLGRLHDAGLFNPYEIFLRAFFRSQAANPDFRPADLTFNHQGRSNLDAAILDIKYLKQAHKYPPLFEQADAPFVKVLRAAMGFAPAVKTEAAALKIAEAESPAAEKSADEMTAERLHAQFYARIHRLAQPFFYPSLIVRWLGIARGEDGEAKLEQAVIQYEKDQARRLTFADQQAGLHAVLDEVKQAVLAARSEMRGGAAKERTDDLVTRFVPGARAIDMTFDSERLAQVPESVQARIGRIAAEYRKDWLPGDANAESGFSEVKRAVKIDLEKPVMVDGELYDQVEISGVLFTPENLNKPFRNKSVMGTGKSVEDLGEEAIREDAVDVGVDPDGRFNLTPEKPAQEGGHGADTAENKFHNARTTLPKRGLKGPAVLGFGRYRDSSLSIAGNRLGVFVSFTRKNGRQRFGEYFRARMTAFSQELTATLRRAEQTAQLQSLLSGVRVVPNEGAIVRRIEARYGFQQLIQRYGEELGGLVEQGIYPNTPHFNNMEIDFEGTEPVTWYDLGGWKLRENLTPLQAFGYAYWTLDFGVMVISRDTALLRILRSRGLLDWSPHETFLRGFFKAQQESGVFEPSELEVNAEGISNLDVIILSEENRAASSGRLSLPPMAEQRDKPFVPVLRVKLGMDRGPSEAIAEAQAIYDELASSVPRPAAGFFYPKLIEKWINLAAQENGINLLDQEVNGFLSMVQKRLYPGQYDDFKTVIDEARRRIAALRSEMRVPEKAGPRPALRGWEQTRIFIPRGERLFVGNRYIVRVDAVSFASRAGEDMVRLSVNVPQSAWVRSEEKFNETRVTDVLAHRRGEGPSFAERSLDPDLVYLPLHRFNDQSIVAGSGRTKTGVLENDLEMRLTVSRIFRSGRQFGVELLVETPSGVLVQKELPQIPGWERAMVFLPAGERLLIAGKYILRAGNIFYGDRDQQMVNPMDFNIPLNGWALTEERYAGVPLRSLMGRGTSIAGIPFDQRVTDPSIKYLTLHRFPGQMIFIGDAMRKTGALERDLDARILVAESIAGEQGGMELQVDVPAGVALELESEPLAGGERRSEMRLNPSDLLPSSWPFGNPLSPAPSVYALDDEHVVDNDTSLAIMRAALQAAARQHREILGFPEGSELSIEGLKQGAFSQIVRILVDEKPSNTILEIPAALDGKAGTIASNSGNFSYYRRLGRSRFTPRPYSLYYIPLNYRGSRFDAPAAIHEYLDGYEELNFGYGTLRRWDASLPGNPFIDIPRAEVPQVLAEIMAAISYHYQPDLDGGTSPVDFYINNGDFVYRKQADGSHDVKIITMRRRQSGISIPKFILSLVQFYSTEDIETDANKVSEDHDLVSIQAPVPVLVSNPGIAFHGILRGREYLYKDLGFQDYKVRAANEVSSWLRQFAASREGRRYRFWVEEFLNDRLPLTFGEDPAEGRPALYLLEEIREQLTEARGNHKAGDFAYTELERKIALINERIPDAFEISNAEAAVIPFSAEEIGQIFAAKNLLASEPVKRGEQAEKITARLRQVTDRRFSPADIDAALGAVGLEGAAQDARAALASELNSKFVFARSEMREVSEARAREFTGAVSGLLEILNRPEYKEYSYLAHIILAGLPRRNFAIVRGQNGRLAAEVIAWAEKITSEYPDIVPFISTASRFGDLLFNSEGNAILVFGKSEAGKGSIGYALSRASQDRIRVAAQDNIDLIRIPGHLLALAGIPRKTIRARAYDPNKELPYQTRPGVGLVKAEIRMESVWYRPEEHEGGSFLALDMDAIFPDYKGQRLAPWKVLTVQEPMTDAEDYEKFVPEILPELEGPRSEMRTQKTAEKPVWAARAASESSRLAVARDITARILGLNVMRRLYNMLFPKISKDTSAAMAAPARAALAADYTQLFRSGGSTVLPVSLLERLSPEAREVYLEIIYEGFRKSGQAPRPFIYFAGSSSEAVKMQISGRGFFRNHPGSQDLFRFSRQSEYTEAVWHKKQDISVALSGIAENETVEYRIPAFLLGADEIKQLDDPAFFKYVHQLTELQLLAASELKHALAEAVNAKQMAAVTGDFLHRAGVHDFKTGASGFLMPSPGSLLAADLTRYIQTRALTEAAA